MNTDYIISLVFISIAWLLILYYRERSWIELVATMLTLEPMDLLRVQREFREECEADEG